MFTLLGTLEDAETVDCPVQHDEAALWEAGQVNEAAWPSKICPCFHDQLATLNITRHLPKAQGMKIQNNPTLATRTMRHFHTN